MGDGGSHQGGCEGSGCDGAAPCRKVLSPSAGTRPKYGTWCLRELRKGAMQARGHQNSGQQQSPVSHGKVARWLTR